MCLLPPGRVFPRFLVRNHTALNILTPSASVGVALRRGIPESESLHKYVFVCVNMHTCELTAPSAFVKTSTGLYICDHNPPDFSVSISKLAKGHLSPCARTTNEDDSLDALVPQQNSFILPLVIEHSCVILSLHAGFSQIPDPHRHNTPRKSGVGGGGGRGGREGGPENIPEEEGPGGGGREPGQEPPLLWE